MQVIRGGRLLDPPRHRGELGDLFVDGDTIREVGPPGLAVPAGAQEVGRGACGPPGGASYKSAVGPAPAAPPDRLARRRSTRATVC